VTVVSQAGRKLTFLKIEYLAAFKCFVNIEFDDVRR